MEHANDWMWGVREKEDSRLLSFWMEQPSGGWCIYVTGED